MTQPGVLETDLHGKTVSQALTAINALLRRAGAGTYRIRIIHGCHGGTALRDAIASEYAHHPRVVRIERSPDGGATALILREY